MTEPTEPSAPPEEPAPAAAKQHPLRKAYLRVGLLVVAVVVARVAFFDSDGSEPADGSSSSTAAGASADDLTAFAAPPAIDVGPFDPATEDVGESVFEDATAAAGIDFASESARVDEIEIPTSQLATLLPGEDRSDAVVDAWARRTLSAYLVDVATYEHYGTGQAWGDVDGDGDPDLYLTNQTGPNVLYRNQGDGTFEPSDSPELELADQFSSGATFVDYDNDGWPDLHVLGREGDALLHNDEGKGFTDVTEAAGIDDPGQGQTSTWADYDGDGDLDVYVVDYGCQPCNGAPPVARELRDQHRLFRNEGDGTFTDLTKLIDDIDGTRGLGFAATWFDYDQDGRPDLYVVNDARDDQVDDEVAAGQSRGDGSTPGNALIRNVGPGCGGWCFEDVSEASGTDVRANAMGLAVADLDGNGADDLFFTNSGHLAGPTKLLLNQGDGTFEDASEERGANLGEWSWGTSALDADGDGRLDLYVAVGESELARQATSQDLPDDPATMDVVEVRAGLEDGTLETFGMIEAPPWPVVDSRAPRTDNDRLLLQQPDGTFVERILGPTDELSGMTYGSAVADFDGDGRPDVVAGSIDAGYHLLRNRGVVGAGNQRLAVRLQGDGEAVSRDAVGAVITVTADGREQRRTVTIGGSMGSGEDLTLLFGLGSATEAEVEVAWPDGTETDLGTVAAGQHLRIAQGDDEPVATPLRAT